MKNNRQEISIRIRGAREAYGLSIAEVAEALGISSDTYRAYEDGLSDVPMGILPKLATLLHTEQTALLTGRNAHSTVFSVTRAGNGPVVARRAAYHYESLNAAFARAKMTPYIVTVLPPEDPHAPLSLNTHDGEEFNLMISGRMEVTVDGHTTLLNAGDSIYFDSTKPHGMRAAGTEEARFLAIITA